MFKDVFEGFLGGYLSPSDFSEGIKGLPEIFGKEIPGNVGFKTFKDTRE